jgi:hypothetical protein
MPLITDLIMILLLLGVIVQSIRLHRVVATVRNLNREVSPMINELSTIITQSARSIEHLKEASLEAHYHIAEKLKSSHTLRTDLEFLIQHGEKIADRLEELMQKSFSTQKGAKKPYKKSKSAEESEVIPLYADPSLQPQASSAVKGRKKRDHAA